MIPFTPTFDALAKEFNETRARVELLTAENVALKAMAARNGLGDHTEVRIFGYTLKELADMIERYKKIEAAMRGKDFS